MLAKVMSNEVSALMSALRLGCSRSRSSRLQFNSWFGDSLHLSTHEASELSM